MVSDSNDSARLATSDMPNRRLTWVCGMFLSGIVLAQEPVSRTATQWIEELSEERVEATATALAEFPTDESLPPLVTCIAEERLTIAWHAMRTLRRVCAGERHTSRHHTAAAERLAELLADTTENDERRELLALSIGAMGPHGVAVAPQLVEVLSGTSPAAVRLSAAIAVSDLGKAACRPLLGAIDEGRYLTGALALGVAAALAKEGRSLDRYLQNLIATDKSIRAYLLCRAAREALAVRGLKRSAVAWEKRLKMHRLKRLGPPIGAKLNLSADCPSDPESALLVLRQGLGLEEPPSGKGVSLPETFESPVGEYWCFGDALQCFAAHISTETRDLQSSIRSDEIVSLVDWRAKRGPLLPLLTLLSHI